MERLPNQITICDKYGPAMEITDEAEASAYFELCVEHAMRLRPYKRSEAESIERENLGYYAGYYSNEVRQRVERLFNCSHPIFGKISKVGAPTFEEALQAGLERGRALRNANTNPKSQLNCFADGPDARLNQPRRMEMTQQLQIPLKELLPGDKFKGGSINSRKTETPIDGLAKSIVEHGLIVPLIVRKNGDGQYYVIDGNRRLAALNKIHAKDKTIQVFCVESTDGNALELSMVANIDRAELHPVDQFEVFGALIAAGDTVDAIAKRYGMKVPAVRQALALGRLAPAIRDAWRDGQVSEEAAEAFSLTSDHKAQMSVFKKVGKHANPYQIKRMLAGEGNQLNVSAMLKFVGRQAYEAAGHEVNQSLFSDNEDDAVTVSDLPALKQMFDDKIERHCQDLIAEGWKWAISKFDAPHDTYAWRRIEEKTYTKEQMAALGCIVGPAHDGGSIQVTRGFVKPGDKVSVPKSPRQRKAEAKKREEKKEEGGGLSNALAFRLSKQLTAAIQEAFAEGVTATDVLAFTAAALASANSPMRISIDGVARTAELKKYFEIADERSSGEVIKLIASWLAKSIDFTSHTAESLTRSFTPKKGEDQARLLIASHIKESVFQKAVAKHFDAADYFSSVNKGMIEDAVREALGETHFERVSKMKTQEAREYAIKHVPKTGWVPAVFRLDPKK